MFQPAEIWWVECSPNVHGFQSQSCFSVQVSVVDCKLPKPPSRAHRQSPLLLLRKQTEIPLPPSDMPLRSGDRILFAGKRGVETAQERFLLEPSPLEYVRTGIEPPRSWLFRRWFSPRNG